MLVLKNHRLWSIILISLLLSACVTMQTAVEKESSYRPKMAYVYGKFSLVPHSHGANIALQLTTYNKGGEKLIHKYVELKRRDDIYAVEVPPGAYDFGKIVFLNDVYRVIYEKDLNPNTPVVRLNFDPGKAYYLGDYNGEGSVTPMGRQVRVSWRLHNLDDNFSDTTRKFETIYRNFVSIEKVNILKQFRAKIMVGVFEDLKKLEGFIKDKQYGEAVRLARELADNGSPYAQVRLGYLYEKGLGIAKSHVDAGNWYHKAALKDYSEGMLSLGILLLSHGPASESSPQFSQWRHLGVRSEGFYWIENAAYKGNTRAMAILCMRASNQALKTQSRLKSFAWCELALEQTTSKQGKLQGIVQSYHQKAKTGMDSDMLSEAQALKAKMKAEMKEK